MNDGETFELTWNCGARWSDVNLGTLVALGVLGKHENTKIAKKYFLMLEWGMPYTFRKLNKKDFQQAKDHLNRMCG